MPEDPAFGTAREERGIPVDRALAALPLETPPRSAWPLLAVRLRARRRRRWRGAALALAAVIAAVALLPAVRQEASRNLEPPSPAAQSLAALMRESARLEGLLQEDGAAPWPAPIAMLSLDIEERIQALDAALAQTEDDPVQAARLWRQRVALLHDLNRLQQARYELAGESQPFDAALVVAY